MKASIRRIAAIVLRYFYLLRGSPTRILPLFIWAAIDLVMWGFTARYLNSLVQPGFDFIPAFLGAVLLYDFFTRVMHGVAMVFLEDVWSRNFLNFFATPLGLWEYTAGLVAACSVASAVTVAVIIGCGAVFFGLSYLVYGWTLALFFLILFVFGVAMGILSATVVLRNGPAAEWLIWPIPGLLLPLAGVFYPISVLPAWLRWAAYLLPPSYVFETARAMLQDNPAPPAAMFLGTGLAVIYVVLAYSCFSRVYQRALQNGLIQRFNAESVN